MVTKLRGLSESDATREVGNVLGEWSVLSSVYFICLRGLPCLVSKFGRVWAGSLLPRLEPVASSCRNPTRIPFFSLVSVLGYQVAVLVLD